MSDACSSCRGSGVVHCEPCVACSGRGAPETELATLRARISTLEARIADVEGENTALWNKLDAEIERRVDAEARVAELERERVAAVDKYDQAMAALDAMSESHGNVAAARDEAVGLLERVDDRVDFATGWDEGSRDHNDVLNDVRAWRLARLDASAPDKEPRQPGPGSGT